VEKKKIFLLGGFFFSFLFRTSFALSCFDFFFFFSFRFEDQKGGVQDKASR
jgi:hypothetical protein